MKKHLAFIFLFFRIQLFLPKNLVGVPSEAELQEKGLGLAEMQAIQMRKIEQIYKHLWKLEKENKALKEEVKRLQK